MNNELEARPLERRHMPVGDQISLAAYTHRGTAQEQRIPVDFGLPQPLAGFEPTYRNIIDYIVRITYRIWEQREPAYIRATYHPNSRVFDDYGLQRGAEKIVRDTEHTTGAFSNIQLIADEIVWAGDDQIGFHTSHRTIIRGTNDGASKYGPATQRNVDVWCIANCVALRNQIFLEHVLYNTSDLLRQLGFDLEEVAVKLAELRPPGWGTAATDWEALRAAARPPAPISVADPVSGFDVDAFVRRNFDDVWNQRNFARLLTTHQSDVAFHGPTGRSKAGRAAYQSFQTDFLSCFPDLRLQIDEVYWMGNESQGYLTSERWSAIATHSVAGMYGNPTHRKVRIWGITQHKIVDRQIVEEWTMFNELDLMMQIYGRLR